MSKLIVGLIGAFVIVLTILAFSSLYTVSETQQALVLQFGEPIGTPIQEPGLHVKSPLIQEVRYYDRRVLDLDPPAERVILADQKPLWVDAFVRYKIIDPLRFFQTVQTESRLRDRLGQIVNASVRSTLGSATLSTVLSNERASLMAEIRGLVSVESTRFGIAVVDVRIRRADLPEETSQAVYQRMRSERNREAAEFRAQGFERAQRVISTADREATVLRAEAEREAQILRGEGDGQKTKILAEAYSKDEEFFRFYKSMSAYTEALGSKNTTMVLTPDSDFFKYFNTLPSSAEGD
jgi:membrane protease subunit HflC